MNLIDCCRQGKLRKILWVMDCDHPDKHAEHRQLIISGLIYFGQAGFLSPWESVSGLIDIEATDDEVLKGYRLSNQKGLGK